MRSGVFGRRHSTDDAPDNAPVLSGSSRVRVTPFVRVVPCPFLSPFVSIPVAGHSDVAGYLKLCRLKVNEGEREAFANRMVIPIVDWCALSPLKRRATCSACRWH
jgi:hypothetical protein